MTKRMLIDATHAEETRVVVLDGNKLEDFDVETSTKRQLKGNIYLAKVVRVEPSLQSAFVEYGGGRHGFLAFGEIHPDYYQIPVADRQRLLALQAEEARAAEDDDDDPLPVSRQAAPSPARATPPNSARSPDLSVPSPHQPDLLEPAPSDAAPDALADAATEFEPAADPETPDLLSQAIPDAGVEAPVAEASDAELPDSPHAQPAMIARDERYGDPDAGVPDIPQALPDESDPTGTLDLEPGETSTEEPPEEAFSGDGAAEPPLDSPAGAPEARDNGEFDVPPSDAPPPETVGGDADAGDGAEQARQRRESRFLRNYRIQEVIRRRQIMLVQVVKEERGTKGAALTTYISLAGRYSVLMPNSPRGGGISRKITSAADRRRLKEITTELEVPPGMGLIVRTAGANRPKPEIVRDCEYLMRLWDDIREHTMRSMAPALIYEEASLIKRAIRDVYSRDIDEIVVDGEAAWHSAHEFMRMLMPSHARKVLLWRNAGAETAGQPLFSKYSVDAQLDAMLSPTVQLKSGGYLVIDQTEALVAIDVNSGRSTRERNIEETALRTNLEAADEAARQLRLRDLAGLIVIDFIDMESKRNNAAVERRVKEALKADRARIQVGGISHFGLLEMSRQRLRPSFTETSFVPCPACGGQGHVRSTESSAVSVLRAIEDEGAKARASLVMVHVASSMVMYLVNHKRARLAELEARYGMAVQFTADESLIAPALRIDRLRPKTEGERPALASLVGGPVAPAAPMLTPTDEEFEDDDLTDAEIAAETSRSAPAPATAGALASAPPAERGEGGRRRRRRRRGGRRDTVLDAAAPLGATALAAEADEALTDEAEADEAEVDETEAEGAEAEGAEAGATGGDDEAPEIIAANVAEIDSEPEAALAATAEAPASLDLALAEQPSLDLTPAQPELAESATAPAAVAAETELDENGEPKARRRGRRGGRRRRREPGEEGAEAGEAAPLVAAPSVAASEQPTAPAAAPVFPAYVGPTPADPFGGTGFDIFDILDQAEQAEQAAAHARAAVATDPASAAVSSRAEVAPSNVAVVDAVPVAAELVAPETVAPETVAPEMVPPETVAAEMVPPEIAAAETVAEPIAVPEPEPAESHPIVASVLETEPAEANGAIADSRPEPRLAPIQPVIVGAADAAGERKRGWWRR